MGRGKHKSKALMEPQELHKKPGKVRRLTSQSKTIIDRVRVALYCWVDGLQRHGTTWAHRALMEVFTIPFRLGPTIQPLNEQCVITAHKYHSKNIPGLHRQCFCELFERECEVQRKGRVVCRSRARNSVASTYFSYGTYSLLFTGKVSCLVKDIIRAGKLRGFQWF